MLHYFMFIFYIILQASAGVPWEPEPRNNDTHFMDRHTQFVENTRQNYSSISILFYGDSITNWWSTIGKSTFDEFYKPLGTANYGSAGDRTEHLLWRIKNGEITDQLNPKLCVLKIGTNNIQHNEVNDIAMGVLFIVHELRERLPNMKILLLGILPRTNEELTNRTIKVNEIIKRWDNGETIRFLDMGSYFWNEGEDFNRELYNEDMLHLSEAGYAKWARVMDPMFQEMLGSSWDNNMLLIV